MRRQLLQKLVSVLVDLTCSVHDDGYKDQVALLTRLCKLRCLVSSCRLGSCITSALHSRVSVCSNLQISFAGSFEGTNQSQVQRISSGYHVLADVDSNVGTSLVVRVDEQVRGFLHRISHRMLATLEQHTPYVIMVGMPLSLELRAIRAYNVFLMNE